MRQDIIRPCSQKKKKTRTKNKYIAPSFQEKHIAKLKATQSWQHVQFNSERLSLQESMRNLANKSMEAQHLLSQANRDKSEVWLLRKEQEFSVVCLTWYFIFSIHSRPKISNKLKQMEGNVSCPWVAEFSTFFFFFWCAWFILIEYPTQIKQMQAQLEEEEAENKLLRTQRDEALQRFETEKSRRDSKTSECRKKEIGFFVVVF